MKKQTLLPSRIFAAVLFVAIGSALAADEEWKMFRIPEGGLVCELPGEPQTSKQTVNTPAGPMEVVTYQLDRQTVSFVVSATKLPPSALVVPTEQRLDNSRDGAVKGIEGGELIGEKHITLEKYPGREILIKHPGGAYLHQQIYMVNDRIVQAVAVLGSEEKTAQANQFFKSLKLLKN